MHASYGFQSWCLGCEMLDRVASGLRRDGGTKLDHCFHPADVSWLRLRGEKNEWAEPWLGPFRGMQDGRRTVSRPNRRSGSGLAGEHGDGLFSKLLHEAVWRPVQSRKWKASKWFRLLQCFLRSPGDWGIARWIYWTTLLVWATWFTVQIRRVNLSRVGPCT